MAHHEATCRVGGADRLATRRLSVRRRACVVHYHHNDKSLKDGDLLLMDAGCELNGYVSDITRTWPVNGKWTSAQLDVYSAVLEAHAECLKAARADGETSLMDLHHLSIKVLAKGLSKLLPNTSAHTLIHTGAYTKYYPHSGRTLVGCRRSRRSIRLREHSARTTRGVHHRARLILPTERSRRPRESPRCRRSHRRRLRGAPPTARALHQRSASSGPGRRRRARGRSMNARAPHRLAFARASTARPFRAARRRRRHPTTQYLSNRKPYIKKRATWCHANAHGDVHARGPERHLPTTAPTRRRRRDVRQRDDRE